MSDETPRLKLAQLVSLQEANPITWNEALAKLDALVDLCLIGQNINTPPPSPADGDAYLIGGAPTGAWSGYAFKIATCLDATWRFHTPFNGLRAYLPAEGASIVYQDGVWVAQSVRLSVGAIGFGDTSGNGGIAQDQTKLFFDSINGYLGVGTNAPDCPLTLNHNNGPFPYGISGTVMHMIGADNANGNLTIDSFGSATGGISIRKVGGTRAAPLALSNGIPLGVYLAAGFNGAGFVNSGAIRWKASQDWNVGSCGADLFLELVTNGSAVRTAKATLFNDGRFQPIGAYADQSYVYQQLVTGFAFSIPDTCGRLILDPAATLATGTITLPANPKDGQLCKITSTQIITTLSIQAATGHSIVGAIGSIAAGAFAEFTFVATAAKWFRSG